MEDTKKWWQSKTYLGALIGGIGAVLQIFGISIDAIGLTDSAVELITVVGTVLAALGIRTADKPISPDVV